MYTYPIDFELYTSGEAVVLVEFLALVEDANEGKVDSSKLLKKYKQYRSIINSVSTEKQMDREFEKISGYSIYKTINKHT
ncbi:MAG: UPF0223 family protein [Candidatus Izimaplasma sp.]|nr:UPF0223 family protein [Candidatus Izimaplasma bacterium]